MKKTVRAATLLIIGILLPVVCAAQNFSEKGYDLSMKWRQSTDQFLVKGEIKKGETCKQLKVSIDFKNTGDTAGSAHIEKTIKYNVTTGVKFEARDKVQLGLKYKNQWVINTINIECIN
jgi:hypothetical protein